VGGATAPGNHGLYCTSTGNGHAIYGFANGSGFGLRARGGTSSGAGAEFIGVGGNSPGIQFVGQGSAAGVLVQAGATGIGLDINGGATSGAGVDIATSNGVALNIASSGGVNHGVTISAASGGSGAGVRVAGGTASGAAIHAVTSSNGIGVRLDGSGTGVGIQVNGGATGIGLDINGGATSGDAVSLSVTSGHKGIAQGITQNVALANFEFRMLDTSGNPATGLTVVEERSIDGAAFAACANAFTEVSNGVYKIDLAASDLNGKVITFRFSAAGAKDTVITVVTEP